MKYKQETGKNSRRKCSVPILFWLIGVLACLPSISSAQGKGLTLNVKEANAVDVFKEIERQTSYKFFYKTEQLSQLGRVSLQVDNAPLGEVLKKLFAGSHFSYEIAGNQIVVLEREMPEVKEVTVSGKVTDIRNQPLPGVAVILKGTSIGTATDVDGKFSLTVPNDKFTLVFSMVGMKEHEELVTANHRELHVVMEEDVTEMEEVIVTGYQTISRERSTGAFDLVSHDAISRAHASDLSTALLGSAAGLQGVENEDGSIDYVVRGVSSLYANTEPLVVVDGFPVANGFDDINPNDVVSVTLLKDAAAASIWGARAANGVIVVTTRQGSREAFSVEVNAMVSIGRKLDLSTALTTASSEDQVFYERLAMENGWLEPTADALVNISAPTSLAKEYMYDYMNQLISKEEMEAGLEMLSKRNNREQIKRLLLQHPVTQQYNLSISNSGKRTKNYFSVMYENVRGSLIENRTERWRVNFNNVSSVCKWLDFSAGVNVHYATDDYSGPTLAEISALSPYEMILNEDGTYATQLMKNRKQLANIGEGVLSYEDWGYNILREVRARDYGTEILNLRLQAGLSLKLFPGWSFDSKFQYELNRSDDEQLDSEDSFFVRDMVNSYVNYDAENNSVLTQFIPKGAIVRSSSHRMKNYTWRNQLNINEQIKERHAINAIVGFEVSNSRQEARTNPYIYGLDVEKNIVTPLPFGGYSGSSNGQNVSITNISGMGVVSLPGMVLDCTDEDERFVSVYANVGYSLDERISLSASVRSDASNLITEKASYRWAPLWSVGASWNLHDEGFMDSSKGWLDRLTVRLTYGFNGNVEKSTSPVTLVSSDAEPSLSTGLPTTSVVNRGNPNLRWEKTSTVNGGIDFGFFSNRLYGSVDVYSKQGRDLIGDVVLPSVLGASSQRMNSAKLSNKGVELALGSSLKLSQEIDFALNVNYAYNKNEVKKVDCPVMNASYITGGAFVAGYPAQSIWSVNYLGMEDGIAYVEGVNGQRVSMNDNSLIYRDNALGFLKYMGPATDPHSMGLTAVFNGYGFNLSFLVLGKFGGHFRVPYFNDYIESDMKYVANYFIREVLEGNERYPAFQPADQALSRSWTSGGGYAPILNTLVESSSSIKLKEISLEYNMPAHLVQHIGIKGIKFYGQVRDLGCIWTANRYGFDPEWLPGTMKPSTSFKFGVTVVL